MYLQARLNLHTRLYSRAQASSRNLVSARVQRTCCQNTRECVWVGGDEGARRRRTGASLDVKTRQIPTHMRSLHESARSSHASPRRTRTRALFGSKCANTYEKGACGPPLFSQLQTLRRLHAAAPSPALVTTRVTARSSNSSRSINGRSRATSYLPMSFWMRSMASTVASASPKAVRRT